MWIDRFSCVAVVAPAGPLPAERAAAGIARLEACGVRVKVMEHVFSGAEQPYLAASAAERAADLTAAWLDPEVELILCARGGFGSAHLLPLLDWERLRRRELPVVGFSDITALHFAMDRLDCGAPVAAPMLGKLVEAERSDYGRRELCAAFAAGGGPRRIGPAPGDGYRFLKSGRAVGRPLVGNLTVAASLCGTPFLPSATGRIVVLEDLNEAPYRIDRSLTQLAQSGFFDGCAGVALGGFSDCGDPAQLERVFRRIAEWTAGPVVMHFPFSHGLPVAALHFKQTIELEGRAE